MYLACISCLTRFEATEKFDNTQVAYSLLVEKCLICNAVKHYFACLMLTSLISTSD